MEATGGRWRRSPVRSSHPLGRGGLSDDRLSSAVDRDRFTASRLTIASLDVLSRSTRDPEPGPGSRLPRAGAPRDALHGVDRVFGCFFFRGFNRVFGELNSAYAAEAPGVCACRLCVVLYVGLIALTVWVLRRCRSSSGPGTMISRLLRHLPRGDAGSRERVTGR